VSEVKTPLFTKMGLSLSQQCYKRRVESTLPQKLFRLETVKIEMLKKINKADIWQLLRFCVVGTSNAVIDFGILNLLLWMYPTTDLWTTLGYNSIAVALASTNSFFWNKYWTFQQRNPITIQETYRFVVLAGGTTLMNDTLMWLLGKVFPNIMASSLIGANALKLTAIIGTMSISFFGMRLWVFFHNRFAGEAEALIEYGTDKLLAIEAMYDPDASTADDKTAVSLDLR
jgi:putative flippase GtrA